MGWKQDSDLINHQSDRSILEADSEGAIFCTLKEKILQSDSKVRKCTPGPNRASANEQSLPLLVCKRPRTSQGHHSWQPLMSPAILPHSSKPSPFSRFYTKDRFDGEQMAQWRNKMLVFLQQRKLLGFFVNIIIIFLWAVQVAEHNNIIYSNSLLQIRTF